MTPGRDVILGKLAPHGIGPDTDLIGDPVEPPPPMAAPLPWRVWKTCDGHWFLARTEAEAIAATVEYWRLGDDQATEDSLRAEGELHDLHELTDAELNRHMFTTEDGPKHTFMEELKRRVADVSWLPPSPHASLFATTEY